MVRIFRDGPRAKRVPSSLPKSPPTFERVHGQRDARNMERPGMVDPAHTETGAAPVSGPTRQTGRSGRENSSGGGCVYTVASVAGSTSFSEIAPNPRDAVAGGLSSLDVPPFQLARAGDGARPLWLVVDKGVNGTKGRYPRLEVGQSMHIIGMGRRSGQRLSVERNKDGALYRTRTVADGVIVTRHR